MRGLATEKQKNLLTRFEIAYNDDISKQEASDLIVEQIEFRKRQKIFRATSWSGTLEDHWDNSDPFEDANEYW